MTWSVPAEVLKLYVGDDGSTDLEVRLPTHNLMDCLRNADGPSYPGARRTLEVWLTSTKEDK